MLGRSWCPCRRDAGIADAVEATGSLCLLALPGATPTPWVSRIVLLHTRDCGSGRDRPVGRGPTLEGCSCSPTAGSLGGPARPSTSAGSFTAWALDPVLTVVIVWVAGALPVRRVACCTTAGDRWPLGAHAELRRRRAWAALFFATSSGLGTYDTTLLSVHMVQHMVLSMFVPLFLALGAPVTLMLRTLPPRPRRWLLARAALAGWRWCCPSRR